MNEWSTEGREQAMGQLEFASKYLSLAEGEVPANIKPLIEEAREALFEAQMEILDWGHI